MLEAILRAFAPEEQEGRSADDDHPRQEPRAAGAVGGVKAAGAGADGGLGQGRVAAEDLVAREAELRDEFLRQALSLIEEGSAGLSAQHRAVVEKAISVGHPWVSAIYDECKETGDVRGLMQNLQCLPALLERDQAAVLAANTSQPPPPGEADSPFWPRRQQQQQPQQPQQQQRQQPHQQQQPQRQHEQEPQPSGSRTVLSAKNSPHVSVLSSSASTPTATAAAEPSGLEAAAAAAAAAAPANSSSASTQAGNAADGTAAASRGGLVDRGKIAHGKGEAGNPAFDMVVGQLCRVVAGCSQLLRLRGVIGEREERTLKIMSNRGSPVLLAAVEAYGTNQDLEDLLDTLHTAAEIELSLTADAPPSATAAAAAAAVPDTRRADLPQQRRALPHQQQQQRQPSVVGAGGGRGGLDLGSKSGVSRDGGGREQDSAGASSDGESGDGDGGRDGDGDATGETTWSRPAAEVKTPAAAAAAAVGARAQELMKARFAGMKSAAEAKSAAAAAAAAAAAEGGGGVEGSKSASSAASSFGKGNEGKEPSGDRRLRQDVSQLVAVMAKQGMLTDRQRLFLLAQVGRRITRTTREKHAQYLATGNSKELYTVLMALSMPPPRKKKKKDKAGASVRPAEGQEDYDDDDGSDDEDDDDDDDESAWDEESGEEESDEEEEQDRKGERKREQEMGMGVNMENDKGGNGMACGPGHFDGDKAVGGGVAGQDASEGGEPQQAFEACDAPEL
ncbi:unnamed protein product [Ectocarpus fasciculatus]